MSNLKNFPRGSAIVYSLIVLSAMLFITASISVVANKEKKNASSTTFSVQAYQTADSGVQLALKKIGANPSKTILETYPSCVSGVVSNNTGAGPDGAEYKLSFFSGSNGDVQITDCNALASTITSIKSVGTYKDTVRAVQVAVAAGGPDFSYGKICQGIYVSSWLNSIPAPNFWTIENCKRSAKSVSENAYRLGCYLSSASGSTPPISWGPWTTTGSTATPPSPNCGW